MEAGVRSLLDDFWGMFSQSVCVDRGDYPVVVDEKPLILAGFTIATLLATFAMLKCVQRGSLCPARVTVEASR